MYRLIKDSKSVALALAGVFVFGSGTGAVVLRQSQAIATETTPAAGSPTKIYDESADAERDIAQALAAAKSSGKAVLLVFGANWCGDCRALDQAMHDKPLSDQVHGKFHVVKVDVARFSKNKLVAQRFSVPLDRGIPTVAVLDNNGAPRFATQAGELADARKLGPAGIARFFEQRS